MLGNSGLGIAPVSLDDSAAWAEPFVSVGRPRQSPDALARIASHFLLENTRCHKELFEYSSGTFGLLWIW